MRSDTDLRDAYIESAHKIEADLRLPEVMPADFDPGERDTFPFEERRLLGYAVEAVVADDMDRCGKLIKGRERSVWRREPQRSPAWTALERGTALLTRLSDMDKAAAGKKVTGSPAEGIHRGRLVRCRPLPSACWKPP